MSHEADIKARKRLRFNGLSRVRDRLMLEQEGECYYCFRKIYTDWKKAKNKQEVKDAMATIDHVHPISLGGTWKKYNIVLACRKCNRDKAAMAEEDFHNMIIGKIKVE